MIKGTHRKIAAAMAALGMGIGGAVWATSSASATPTAIRECAAGQLAVWTSPDLANGTAGTSFYPLEFTNTSGRTCFLVGWPGVSATNRGNKQLGSAARRDTGVPRKVVNVAPGATAHATLGYVDVQVDKTAGCKETTSTFLKVFPPDARSARLAFFDVPVCTVKGRVYLVISRIQPGQTQR